MKGGTPARSTPRGKGGSATNQRCRVTRQTLGGKGHIKVEKVARRKRHVRKQESQWGLDPEKRSRTRQMRTTAIRIQGQGKEPERVNEKRTWKVLVCPWGGI